MSAPIVEPQVFTFNARFCGRKNIKNPKYEEKALDVTKPNPSKSQEKLFNIKRAKHEVINYGMTGFDKELQMDSKIAMAIRLGAKPRKKKCINYKDLMEQKRKEKEESKNKEKKDLYNLQSLNPKKRKSSKKKRIKKQPNSIV